MFIYRYKDENTFIYIIHEMDVMEKLEQAATILMAPPSTITTLERQSAERIFLEFRKTRNPFDLCRGILENSKVDYVLFEAATTIREAIIREWSLLDKTQINALCTFVLCCVTEGKGLPNFVKEQLLRAVAVACKLNTLDEPLACSKLIEGLKQLLQNNDSNTEMACCSIMKALLLEYSISNQSSNFRRSLDFHSKCKKSFEDKDLLSIFMLMVERLQKFGNQAMGSLSRQDRVVFARYLLLAEHIFHWEFMNGNPLSLLHFPLRNETSPKVIFKPYKSWRDIMLSPNLIDLFFKLQKMCVGQSELSHHCMLCLVQLASVAGPVFKSDEHSVKYLARYLTCFLDIVNVQPCDSHMAFGLSNIVFRIVDVFPLKILKMLTKDLLLTFFQAMTFMTCSFVEASLDCIEADNNEFEDSVNILLDSWVSIISHSEDFPPGVFVEHSQKIINIYLKSHLASPDGLRKTNLQEGSEICCDLVEMDREAYSDQLSNVGHLSRQNLVDIVNVLLERLKVRTHCLNEMFVNLVAGVNIDNIQSSNMFEDVHWLLMTSSFALSLDNAGESPQIPTEVIDASNKFLTTHTDCVRHTVKYLMSVGAEGDVYSVDPFVALFTTVLKIAELQLQFLKRNMQHAFSPEVASTLLWFFHRWIQGYLPCSESRMSPSLSACFKLDTDCGRFVMKILLEFAVACLCLWANEPQTSDDAVKLLLWLLYDKNRCEVCLSFNTLPILAEKVVTRSPQILALSPSVNRQLVECYMRAGVYGQEAVQMQRKVITPVLEEYQQLRASSSFSHVFQQQRVKETVIRTMECVRGMSAACNADNANFIYDIISPILHDSVQLFAMYSDVEEIIIVILEMFVDVVETLLCILNKTCSTSLCKICLLMMNSYSQHTLGKHAVSSSSEEKKYYDLLLLMQLLTRILSKDYLDMGTSAEDNAAATNPVDVVLYGLHLIIPLINQELLRYPKLSNEYFKLVTFVCEIYPEKMKELPTILFNNFMTSLQLAVTDFSSDTGKCALDALSSLAKYCLNECDVIERANLQLDVALRHFLNVVFHYVVLGEFNMDLIEPSAECLFLLICCHQGEYMKLANHLIAEQHVTDEKFKQKLTEAFQVLTPPTLKLSANRQSLRDFRKNLEMFLQSVKGFLCHR